jgi:hypothetical protein
MSRDAELECAALSARYAFCADRARHLVADLFTEDATLELIGRTMRGREAIRADMTPRPNVVTLHFCTNTLIEVIDADHARGTTHLLSLGHTEEQPITKLPVPMPMGRTGGIYFDEFRRENGRWLFSKRRLEAIFAGPR